MDENELVNQWLLLFDIAVGGSDLHHEQNKDIPSNGKWLLENGLIYPEDYKGTHYVYKITVDGKHWLTLGMTKIGSEHWLGLREYIPEALQRTKDW